MMSREYASTSPPVEEGGVVVAETDDVGLEAVGV